MRESDRRTMLRPLSPGERLDFAMRVYRAVGIPILRQTAVPMVMVYLVVAFYLSFVFPRFFLTKAPESVATQVGEVAITLGAGLFIALPLLLQGVAYTQAVVTRLTADCMLGNVPDETAAASAARRCFGRLFMLNMRTTLTGCFVLVGSLGLLLLSALLEQYDAWIMVLSATLGLFGIVFSALAMLIVVQRHALAPAVITLEETDPAKSIRRSLDLLRAQFPHGSGYDALWGPTLLTLAIGVATGLGFGIALSLMDLQGVLQDALGHSLPARALQDVAARLPWFLALWLAAPAWAVATTILYFDRRIRVEGFDIDVLQQDVRRSYRESRFQL